jgi:hypothetical protein
MKFLTEYRDERIARALAAEIAQRTTRPWVLMEICGGQTHTIMRYGLDELLPRGLELVHGPGCPVCVTPLEAIDAAIALAGNTEVILVSYGDMVRVPGSRSDLLRSKAAGADVRVVYSPSEAVKIARENPGRKVVFLAIGFETTAPANAMAWAAQFLSAGVPCARTASHSWTADECVESRAGVHCPWSCVHGDGLPRIRRTRPRLSRTYRRRRLRAGRSAAGDSHAGKAARGGRSQAGKPVCALGELYREFGGAADHERSVRSR